MEPLIKLNNKNNLFDCHTHKEVLLNGNQQHDSQQYSVYYLSSYRTQQQQSTQRDKNEGFSDAEHHQQLKRSQLSIL
jgi:hypothetical protein